MSGRTLHDKLWDRHRVAALDDGSELLYLDRIVLHERSGAVALRLLQEAGREPFDPNLVFGTLDHVVDTRPGRSDETTLVPSGADFIRTFRDGSARFGLRLFDIGDPRQGIAHVTMPEQGVVLPGISLVCADSHTCTDGALGALAWGIGISETEHALATQTVAVKRPKTMRVTVDGATDERKGPKDVILHLIGEYGASGAVGYMIEFAGSGITSLSIEGRMTLCNMAVEFGAWSAIIAPDDKTFEYLKGRPFAPTGEVWDHAMAEWQTLRTDVDAVFDREIRIDVEAVAPQVTWGTSPQQVSAIDGTIPQLDAIDDPVFRKAARAALDYMGLEPGQPLKGLPIDAVFIGSCTNARLSDLRAAANIVRGRRIASNLGKAIVVPGSSEVKRQAEIEGLDAVFINAGFEWRESGCSLCFYAGGEGFPPGARVASTTNRNFENRQGPGIRTHIMSPAMAAASALTGALADPRESRR